MIPLDPLIWICFSISWKDVEFNDSFETISMATSFPLLTNGAGVYFLSFYCNLMLLSKFVALLLFHRLCVPYFSPLFYFTK